MILAELQKAEATDHARAERFYRPELDVVRFLAFSAVFLHHELPRNLTQETHGVAWGHLSSSAQVVFAGTANAFGFGLPLFFTLSAYLIGTLLLREKEQSGTVDLRAFYIRRILRIWPLYFFGLLIGCTVAVFIDRRPHDVALFAAFALMVGNWLAIVWRTSNPMLPLWSISVEEQFYLFCPVIIRRLSRQGLGVLSWLLIALSDVTLYVLGQRHADADRTIWYNSFVQFQMFGAGLLLCLWMHRRKLNFSLSVGAVGCLLIMLALLHAERKWLPGWMIWLGRISFGLYVYHGLALKFVLFCFSRTRGYEHFLLCFTTSAALTVMMAATSYRFLETPFLRIKERFEVA
jgi:peptidoglycan/LPS O-acetylase OafA/YrhL